MGKSEVSTEVLSNEVSPRRKSFEGSVTSGRSWYEYSIMLGLEARMLAGKRVLNFGCGASNLGKELNGKDLDCQVVDLDLKFDPWQAENPFRLLAYLPIGLYFKLFKPTGEKRKTLVGLRRKIVGTEGREIIQGNGRNLPFDDNSFDFVLALWSVNQVPAEAKEKVIRELLRMGRVAHIGPIWGSDFDLISRVTEELEAKIVTCQKIPLFGSVPFNFGKMGDYDDYTEAVDETSRIKRPKMNQGKYREGTFYLKGGHSIVIKK